MVSPKGAAVEWSSSCPSPLPLTPRRVTPCCATPRRDDDVTLVSGATRISAINANAKSRRRHILRRDGVGVRYGVSRSLTGGASDAGVGGEGGGVSDDDGVTSGGSGGEAGGVVW